MQQLNIYKRRIKQFIDKIYEARYSDRVPLTSTFTYHQDTPIPYDELEGRSFKPISVGDQWGELWGCAWFVFEGEIPKNHEGAEVVALIDVGGEACVFVDGEPERGLTHKKTEEGAHLKRRVPVANPAKPGEPVRILIEAGANGLFGADTQEFTLKQAELAVFHRDIWQLALDMQVLGDLAISLPEDSARMQRIVHGLNQVANLWGDGSSIAECKRITEELLSVPANASDMTVYSIGHAHIDLGWLWPVRETKRKGGRTFATALRLMEEYPEYLFGASQPQLYQWVKDDYPALYAQVKQAIADGRWECQGAMWVEPDMNITGGESLVRQCLYGKAFYRDEFGKDVRNLWLPDVFGYSAALPQILKKSGVDIFMTQKISWNETNVFPYHTFMWSGIDGTEILTHFLPTNNYNLENNPSQLIASQKRFSHLESQDGFLNLYGIGDGGGGPSRVHIERALRLKSSEGAPKVKLAFAEAFFDSIAERAERDPGAFPEWVGELYLELHRGTLTTQGKMKRYNRMLERELRTVEFLSVLAESAGTDYPKALLDQVWKDTMLNQFHDILPGSSITWVYKDAHEVSEKNLGILAEAKSEALAALFGAQTPENSSTFVAVNSLNWDRTEVMLLPDVSAGSGAKDAEGNALPAAAIDAGLLVEVPVPACGYTTVELTATSDAASIEGVTANVEVLENAFVRVHLAEDGSIDSIYDKTVDRESLSGQANRLLLWEDLPYSWDAWDVSHYYRETTPEQAKLVSRELIEDTPLRATVYQKLTVGVSTIEQWIRLSRTSGQVTIENRVAWAEERKLLKVHAETSVHTSEATFEIQYGSIKRPTHRNTSWDQARFEVAAQRYADLSQPDRGIALLNDCKYGYSAYGNSLELSLLRAPNMPDPEADRGVHEFTYAYLPHEGDFTNTEILKSAHGLNDPITMVAVGSAPQAKEQRWFTVSGEGVKIETIKRAEDGIGFVVRLYETRGADERVSLSTTLSHTSVTETDLLENPVAKTADATKPTVSEGSDGVSLEFGPFEIKTLRFA